MLHHGAVSVRGGRKSFAASSAILIGVVGALLGWACVLLARTIHAMSSVPPSAHCAGENSDGLGCALEMSGPAAVAIGLALVLSVLMSVVIGLLVLWALVLLVRKKFGPTRFES